ncbi:MAG: hypothetical protein LBU15_01595 [Rickettsiales bacterium]|jgi:hypothetical protein|nr:hypothetical protein [Rickettsiales bacterium]
MSNNNIAINTKTITLSQSAYDILEIMAECYNVNRESIVETALKAFFNFEIKIDRLRKEGIGRDEIYGHSAGQNLPDANQKDNVVISLKFS